MLYQSQNPHGGDIYTDPVRLDFSSNTNPYGTAPGVVAAMQKVLTQVHHYPDPYCRELVTAIAAHENIPREYIFCGNGAAELIRSYCEALKPKTAVELAPTFSEYALGLERAGCMVERYLLCREQDFLLDDGFLAYIQEKKPEAVFLCNPNNPTGQLISPELLRKILRLCGELSIHLFLDECFLDFADGGESMRAYLADHPQLLILRAFTKSYGMAGVRLGYCMCADTALLSRMAETVQPWNVSLLAQAAGVAALREKEFLQKAKELIPVQRRWLKEELERIGFWVCPSRANYLLLYGEAGLQAHMKAQGIAIRNCDNYHGLTAGWYRVAVRLHGENEALIEAFRLVCGKEQSWQSAL